MKTNFNCLKKTLSIATIVVFGFNNVVAEEVKDAALRLSQQNTAKDYESTKTDIMNSQLNLSSTMRQAMSDINSLTKDKVGSREYLIIYDQLGKKYSKDKIEEAVQLNNLIMRFQESEVKLMESTKAYQSKKNDLDTMFVTREDVLAQVEQLKKTNDTLFKIAEARKSDIEVLLDRIDDMASKIAAIQSQSNPQRAEVDTDKNSAIQNIISGDSTHLVSSNAPEIALAGISFSKGKLKASFLDKEGNRKTAQEGDTLLGGWVVDSISKTKVTMSLSGETISYSL